MRKIEDIKSQDGTWTVSSCGAWLQITDHQATYMPDLKLSLEESDSGRPICACKVAGGECRDVGGGRSGELLVQMEGQEQAKVGVA